MCLTNNIYLNDKAFFFPSGNMKKVLSFLFSKISFHEGNVRDIEEKEGER